ncbi:MAG: serine/threonine-protein kinase [Planctomycetota bacterium]
MAQNELERLFHEGTAQDPSRWDELSAGLPHEERQQLRRMLESDAELQSNQGFLSPTISAMDSTAFGEPELEPTATFTPSGADRRADVEVPESIGDYRILNVIAVHGQGVVYRADHTRLNRQVVIKVVKDELRQSAREALVAEAQSLASLSHPNIAQIFDLTMHNGNPCLVMEYIDGRNLAELHGGAPMPAEKAASLVRQAALGIQHAHGKGIIHRDLKPANVVLRDSDETPKVIDFGLARARHAFAAGSNNSSYGGTIAYMPPEQARWLRDSSEGLSVEDPTDERTDVFALGAILYSLISGKRLYQADKQHEGLEKAIHCEFDRKPLQGTHVPKRVREACLKALAADPKDRFRSAAEFAEALSEPAFRWKPWWIGIGATAIGAILLALGTQLGRQDEPEISTTDAPQDASTMIREVVSLAKAEVALTHYHYPRGAEEGVSYSIKDSPGAVEEDEVDLRVQFDHPSHCFIVALNPDGVVQLCYPEEGEDHLQTDPIEDIKYPAMPSQVFPFTDGAGQQTFLIIWSGRPMDSFAHWSSNLGDVSDFAERTSGRWLWVDHDIESWELNDPRKFTRGSPQPSRKQRGSEALIKLCQRLETDGYGVYAISFPVMPSN